MLVLLVISALLAVTPAAMAIDDYPYPAASAGAVDPWGFYYRYCTSFVAWRMNRDGGPMSFRNYMDDGHWGNAGNWRANALLLGYPVNSTPAVGAIAWWAAGTVSTLGHVAYVEAVNRDGTVVVEEYNYGLRLVYNRRTIPASEPSGYIHIHTLPPDTTAPVIALSCVKDGAIYASAVTPTFLATDAALKSATATLDGAPFTSGARVDAPGQHTLAVTATDVAANKATATAAFTIDPAATDPDVAFTTIAGLDRYETAVRMSQSAFESASHVVIATGENWPDALGGAALAGVLEAPILLTRGGSLPPSVLAEIERLGATSAVILGGEGAVRPSVEVALRAVLGDAVERIGGEDRYATAELIAREVVSAQGDAYDGTCFIATGADFPDALAASPLSSAKCWPLVLATPAGLCESTAAAIDEMDIVSAVVLGGDSAVPGNVEASLVAAGLDAGAVTRLAGINRYTTAALIAGYAAGQGMSWDDAAIATAQDFPDALAGGALQGRLGSVMLLTRSEALVPEARDLLLANKAEIRTLHFLGGEAAVCTGVKLAVSQALE